MSEYKNIGSVRNVLITFVITTLAISTVFLGASAQLGLLSASDVLGGSEDISAIGSVPEDANLVARVDVEGLIQDETTQKVAEESSDQFIDSDKSVQEIVRKSTLGTVETNSSNQTVRTDIQVNDLGETIVFGEVGIQGSLVGQNDYRASIVEIDAEPEEVNKLFYGSEADLEYEYRDQRILENEGVGQVAVVDEGLYIIGQEDAIQDSIDTALGEKESIDEEFIPEVQGDTYVHMLLYQGSDLFDEFDSDQLEGVPIPDNVSVTYTTTEKDTVLINIITETDSDQDTNLLEPLENEMTDYEKIDVSSVSGKEEIEIEVAPEDVDRATSEMKSVFEPSFTD